MIHDIIIIGSGPSGYTAGIYTSRARLSPLLFAGEQFGGQLVNTTQVENFPGFAEGILGPELMEAMRQQALRFGTKILDQNVTKVDFSSHPFKVWSGNDVYTAKAIIIATGAEAITPNLPHEKEFYGRGVSTCAVCDAAFYRGKVVFVVGGGDSAMEDTLALTKFAAKVHLVVRRNELRASKIMQERVLSHPAVEVLWNTEVIEIIGDSKLTHLKLYNNKTRETTAVLADGLFFAIGHKPINNIIDDKIQKDEKGYIMTTLNGLAAKQSSYSTWVKGYPTMTSFPGIFAAGDVVDFRYRQAITAAAMGTMAAIDAERWLEMENTL